MTFVLLGIFGLAAGGLVALGAGALAGFCADKRPTLFVPLEKITVLIPAHQEEGAIGLTVASVRASFAQAGILGEVLVAADSCSDRTAARAREAGAQVQEVAFASKWRTLRALLASAPAGGWIALVDAGALWPIALVAALRPHLEDGSLAAVAPGYLPAQASALERILWKLEAGWKSAENAAGGPISLHGATIFYRHDDLLRALALLGDREQWLNDDIALPLALRIANPSASIRYLNAAACPPIGDAGLREAAPQLARRLRMSRGNAQWLLRLWPRSLLACPPAFLLGLRRALRVFWAYWALSLLFGLALLALGRASSASAAATGAAALVALVLWLLGKRGIVEAGVASLLAPLVFAMGFDSRWS